MDSVRPTRDAHRLLKIHRAPPRRPTADAKNALGNAKSGRFLPRPVVAVDPR